MYCAICHVFTIIKITATAPNSPTSYPLVRLSFLSADRDCTPTFLCIVLLGRKEFRIKVTSRNLSAIKGTTLQGGNGSRSIV